jgi:voltage-gated potassium channel
MSATFRFIIAAILILTVVIGGVAGYMLIEGWTLSDSLYMTMITLTTVGFTEVHPLSEPGRHFTILFLIFSIGTVGYSITTVITFLFEGQFAHAMKERKMEKKIKRIRDHYIICGCGDIGREVALEFQRVGKKFVVVDKNPSASELGSDSSIPFVAGDAVEESVLKEAGIDRAKGLIAALPEDTGNVFVALTARQMNPSLKIVSKASDELTKRKMLKAGADRVIAPYQIAGRRIASTILRPSVVNFLDVFVDGGDVTMRIEEFRIDRSSRLAGKSLRDANIGQHTGAVVLGIMSENGEARTNPSGSTNLSSIRIQEDDVLIAMGSDDHLKSLEDFVRKQS